MSTSELARLAWAQTWQLTSLIVVVAIVARRIGRRRPHLAHVLWLVVLAKCLTPPLIASSGSVFSWLQPATPAVEELKRRSPAPPVPPRVETSRPISADRVVDPDSSIVADAKVDAHSVNMASTAVGSSVWIAGNSTPIDVARPMSHDNDLLRWGGRLWLAGSVTLLAVALRRWFACLRIIRSTDVESRPDLETLLAKLSQRLKVGRRVRLIVTASRIGPAVIGVFRPTILLPLAVVRGKSAGELEAILAHELIHVRRGDLWTGLVQVVAQGVWWFHPLVWLANRRATRSAEACCDEEVVAELGCDPGSYAASLLEILELKRRLISVPAFPGMRPVDVTRERLERIMQFGQGCRPGTPWWCWVVLVLTAAATLPGAPFIVAAAEGKVDASSAAEASTAPLEVNKADKHASTKDVRTDSKLPDDWEPICVKEFGRWRLQIVKRSQPQPPDAPKIENDHSPAATERHYFKAIFSPVDASAEREQSIHFAADRVRYVARPYRGLPEQEHLFEMEGNAEWRLGEIFASARRGTLSIWPAQFLTTAPHNRAEIMLLLTESVSWKSGELELLASEMSTWLGVRGTDPKWRIGTYGLTANGSARLNRDDFSAKANTLCLNFHEGKTFSGDCKVGKPRHLALTGDVTLTTRSPLGERATITADGVVCEGGPKGDLFASMKINSSSAETVSKIEGTGVNSDAGLVGEVFVAETGKDAKESPSPLNSNQAINIRGTDGAVGRFLFVPNSAKVQPLEPGPVAVAAVKSELVTVTYPVADLVVPYSKFNLVVSPTEDAKAVTASQTRNESGGNGYRVHQHLPGTTYRTRDGSRANSAPLIQLIQATIAPESWDAVGGPGSIREFVTTLSLVIRNTQQVHDKIAELMRQLRQIQSQQATVGVEIFHNAAVAATSSLEEIVPTETAKRGADLTKEQLRAFREYIQADGQKWVAQNVKLALHNGQGAELILRCLCRPDTERPPLMQLNQVVAADKSAVRLHVAVGAANAVDALGRSRTFIVKDCQPLLLDVTDDIRAGRLGLPAVEQLQLSKLFQKTGTGAPTRPTERTLLLITPQIIANEEPQEPLGAVKQP